MNTQRIHRALERELTQTSRAIDSLSGRDSLDDVHRIALKCHVLHAVRLTRAVRYLARRLDRE